MDLLVYFAKAGDRVVSADELLRDVWQGRVFDDGIVYKKINQLRKALGDEPHTPRFIETIPKRGYRLVAAVTLAATDEASAAVGSADDVQQTSAAITRLRLAVAGSGLRAVSARPSLRRRCSPARPDRNRSRRRPAPRLRYTPLSFEQDGGDEHARGECLRRDLVARQQGHRVYRRRVPAAQMYVRYLDSPVAQPAHATIRPRGDVRLDCGRTSSDRH